MKKLLTSLLTMVVMLFTTQLQADNSTWDIARESYTGTKAITVYSDPDCGCCSKWIAHLKKHEFDVTDIKTGEIEKIKNKYNVPPGLASCHTAIIDGYVIEGHVPADDIKRLLNTRPDVRGLSVPQMPVGTPGMEMGDRKDDFKVISFRDGDEPGEPGVFQEYTDY